MAGKAKSPVATRDIRSNLPTTFQASREDDVPSAVEPAPKIPTVKKTFHIGSDVVLLLGELQLDELRETGRKPNLSDLVEEGVRLLAQTRRADEDTATATS